MRKKTANETNINFSDSKFAKVGFNATEYAGHSFRIGAATTTASAKLPAWLIKTSGRWSSDCFERYIQTPTSTPSSVSATLANISTY